MTMQLIAVEFPSGHKTYTYQVEGLQGARPMAIYKPCGIAYGRPYGQTLTVVHYSEVASLPSYVTKCLVVRREGGRDGTQWIVDHEEWTKHVAPNPVVQPVAQPVTPGDPKLWARIKLWLDATFEKSKKYFL